MAGRAMWGEMAQEKHTSYETSQVPKKEVATLGIECVMVSACSFIKSFIKYVKMTVQWILYISWRIYHYIIHGCRCKMNLCEMGVGALRDCFLKTSA